MNTDSTRPVLIARDLTTGQSLSWARAVSDVWSGETHPEALELQVIWPIRPPDVVAQNESTIR